MKELFVFVLSLWGGRFWKVSAALLCVVFLLGIAAAIRCPPWYRLRWCRGMEQIGMYNAEGSTPFLLSVRKDRHKAHGRILTVRNFGLSVEYIDNMVPELEAVLNGKIYAIEYGRNTKSSRIFLLPHRYVQPTLISAHSQELVKVPNFLVVGKTGSGKSYALTVLLALFAHADRNTKIFICDYKNSFTQFASTPHFFGYKDSVKGIMEVYDIFTERLSAPEIERDKTPVVLMVDEYGALVSAQDRKTADEIKAKIGNMLFMGRSLGIKVLIGVQRADASYFQAGARDQFHAILAMGNISKEQKEMLFSDFKQKMTDNRSRIPIGEGYLLVESQDIERVKVAPVRDFGEINASIIEALSR